MNWETLGEYLEGYMLIFCSKNYRICRYEQNNYCTEYG